MKPGRPAKKQAPAAVIAATEEGIVRTSDEAAIVSRIMADSKGWENIKESDVDDYAAANDPMELPPPAKEKQRKGEVYFRWIARRPERLDEIRNLPDFLRWEVCNSTTTPFLEGYFDPVLGCVCKLDCMLVYKPGRIYEMEKRYKRQLAEGKDAAGDIKKKDGQNNNGATFVAGRQIGANDTIVADETIDPRIDSFATSQDE